MRRPILLALLAACGSDRSEPASTTRSGAPPVAPVAPSPTDAAPVPRAFGDLFALQFPAQLSELRAYSQEGQCTVGMTFRREGFTGSHPLVELFAYPTRHDQPADCAGAATRGTQVPALVAATVELAGASAAPITLQIPLGPMLKPYLETLATLPADAAAPAVAQALFDKDVFAPMRSVSAALGYRITGVELFMLEPRTELVDLPAAALRALAGASYPPRIPRVVALVLERNAVASRATASTARAFTGVFGIAFPVTLMDFEVTAALPGCAISVDLDRGTSLAVRAKPDGCVTARHLETEVPALVRAGTELLGTAGAPELTMMTSFFEEPVLAIWIPAGRALGPKATYEALAAKMKSSDCFAHLSPLFAALGYQLDHVSIEKVSMQSGKELLAKFPGLATSAKLAPTEQVRVPLMTHLVLVRR